MTWLKLILALSELVLTLTKRAGELRLVREGELKGAQETMELTNERLRKAMEARRAGAGSDAGGVRDPDRYIRD